MICKWFAQPPDDIDEAFRVIKSNYRYVYYKSMAVHTPSGWVFSEQRPVGVDEQAGNCVFFARRFQAYLGGRGEINAIKLWNGEWHAVLDVDGWRLDGNRRAPVKL